MSQLIACLIAYNEEKLLPECLESLRGKADRIVLVDGRIAYYPGDSVCSTDATVEIARSYGAEVVLPEIAWPDEIIMRNQYLLGGEGDWYLMIDADESVLTPLPRPEMLPSRFGSFRIKLSMLGDESVIYPTRLCRHVGRMEYRYTHDALFSNEVLLNHPAVSPILPSVEMIHRQPRRDRQQRVEKLVKRQARYAHEKEHRVRLGL